jgi:hypothetical protein
MWDLQKVSFIMALVWATADRIPRMKETNTSSEQSQEDMITL